METETEQDKIAAAVSEFVEFSVSSELEYQRKLNPERLEVALRERPYFLADYRERLQRQAEEIAADIVGKTPKFVSRLQQGFLHPSNKNYRKLFSAITGIELPTTVGGTNTLIREHYGEILEILKAEREAKRAEEETRRQQHLAEWKSAEIARISQAMLADAEISGPELVEIAQHFGHQLHPRTVGMLRSRVRWIKRRTAGILGKRLSDSAYQLYEDVLLAVQAQAAQAAQE